MIRVKVKRIRRLKPQPNLRTNLCGVLAKQAHGQAFAFIRFHQQVGIPAQPFDVGDRAANLPIRRKRQMLWPHADGLATRQSKWRVLGCETLAAYRL